PPTAKVLPSGEKATDRTAGRPVRVTRSFPVRASHSLTVRSGLPEARGLPSGENETETTPPRCPLRDASCLLVVPSHRLPSPGPSKYSRPRRKPDAFRRAKTRRTRPDGDGPEGCRSPRPPGQRPVGRLGGRCSAQP